MIVRTNLPLLITNRGFSRRKLAAETEINRVYLDKMVSGYMVPSDTELERICKALQTTVDMIYPDPEVRRILAEAS